MHHNFHSTHLNASLLKKRHPVARFYIVDQSLINRGGHHYDYTMCIAQAASKMGFETIIGANKKLSSDTLFPHARISRAFTNTVYQRDSFLTGLRQLKRSSQDLSASPKSKQSKLAELKRIYRQRQQTNRRTKIIERFAKDCQSFFAEETLEESDHVFLTTASELEMMGLAIYLSTNQRSTLPTWHLQFHFNLFDGRTPEYNSQSNVESLMRECFESTLDRLYCHRLHCYTTSEELARQYNRLNVCELTSLPYPVAPEFTQRNESQTVGHANHRQPHFANSARNAHANQASTLAIGQHNPAANKASVDSGSPSQKSSQETSQTISDFNDPILPKDSHNAKPIRFTCPGQIRREKGCFNYLQPLVDRLWNSHLANGKIKIAVQRPARKKFRKQKIELTTPQPDDILNLPHDAIEYFAHPLGREAYIDFIRNTDCGLLFYDSRTYYSRRAGVLGELLSAGKPLIVSAGSWLAEQIAEPNFQYGESLRESATSARQLCIEDVEYNGNNVPSSGGVVSFDDKKHPFQFSLNRQPQEQILLFSFDWRFPTERGTFVDVWVKQRDGQGNLIDTAHQVVGHRDDEQQPNCIFRFLRDAETVEIELRNAYSHSTASLKNINLQLLTLPQVSDSEIVPIASVGVIAADIDQLVSAVQEIERHYQHYASSAQKFAPHWFAMHNPTRTVAHLIASR